MVEADVCPIFAIEYETLNPLQRSLTCPQTEEILDHSFQVLLSRCVLHCYLLTMDSNKRQVQARRLPGQDLRRGINTLGVTQIPQFTFDLQAQQPKNFAPILQIPDSLKDQEEKPLHHEGGHLSPCLPTQSNAQKTRYSSDLDYVASPKYHLSFLGDSSSLFSDESPVTRETEGKQQQDVRFGEPGPLTQQKFIFE